MLFGPELGFNPLGIAIPPPPDLTPTPLKALISFNDNKHKHGGSRHTKLSNSQPRESSLRRLLHSDGMPVDTPTDSTRVAALEYVAVRIPTVRCQEDDIPINVGKMSDFVLSNCG